jgi:hypothetical protein
MTVEMHFSDSTHMRLLRRITSCFQSASGTDLHLNNVLSLMMFFTFCQLVLLFWISTVVVLESQQNLTFDVKPNIILQKQKRPQLMMQRDLNWRFLLQKVPKSC